MKQKSFILFITHSPFETRHQESAYNFALASVVAGHKVEQVFFYSAACHVANSLCFINGDESNIQHKWQSFSTEYKVPLNVCSTAAIKRGIASKDDKMAFDNYAEGFTGVGVMEYFSAIKRTDAIGVQF